MHPNAHIEKPIFVIGCPRSGTSIFADLLGRRPDIVNYSEAGKVWDPVNYGNRESDHYWPPERVTEEDRFRVASAFAFRKWIYGGRYLVNKHPRNSVRIDYIRAIFPDARFIHVIRDGRAVAFSIVQMIEREPFRKRIPFGNFCKPPNWKSLLRDDAFEQAALQWREIVNHILSHKDSLGDKYFEVKYEDLCDNPRKELFGILGLLNIRNNEAYLEKKVPQKMQGQNYKYIEHLTHGQIAQIEAVQAPILEALDYK